MSFRPKVPKESTAIVAAALSALGGRQEDLAKVLQCSQPTVSKYKTGQLDLPSAALLKCIEISKVLDPPNVSELELAERIVRELSGARYNALRRTINELLDAVRERQDRGDK
jgi:predicted transcriptional regulator